MADMSQILDAEANAWMIVAYEVRMFRGTYELFFDRPTFEALSKVQQNAIEESAVLHTRNLCDVFLSRTEEPDDIRLDHLFADWSHSTYDDLQRLVLDLRRRYGSSSRTNSSCWIFNKMMAHCTTVRGKAFDYTNALKSLEAPLKNVIAEIERLRGEAFTWNG